jgi:hypothetical protein
MKKVSAVLGRIIDKGSAASLTVKLTLARMWGEVVGEQLESVTMLDDVRLIGRYDVSVTIQALSSAIIYAKYNAESIMSRICQITGIPSTRLYFKKATRIQKATVVYDSKPTPAEKKPQTIDGIDFENLALKRALEALKTEMQDAA